MDKKLTLSVKKDLIKKAKDYAEKTGQSLSSMVESYFQVLLEFDNAQESVGGVVAEMAGAFEGLKLDKDYKKEIKKAIKKKYCK